MATVTICSDFGAPKNKVCHCFHCFPIYSPWSDGTRWHEWDQFSECWALSQLFHSHLSLSSIGSLVLLCFLPLGWYHLHIWGHWYFSQQSWFSLCFIQSSISHDGLCIYIKYTALTYSFPNMETACCSISSSNCCFLTCIQISQEAGQVVSYSHLFQNFPQFVVTYTVKGFGIFNKAEVDVCSGTLLLFRWSSGCWQFDLCFLCLF